MQARRGLGRSRRKSGANGSRPARPTGQRHLVCGPANDSPNVPTVCHPHGALQQDVLAGSPVVPKATIMTGNGQSQGWVPPLRDWGDRDIQWETAGEGEQTQISWCRRKRERTGVRKPCWETLHQARGSVDRTCELYKKGTDCSPMEMPLNESS